MVTTPVCFFNFQNLVGRFAIVGGECRLYAD